LGICIFLLLVIRSPHVKPGVDASVVIRGLKVATAALRPVALLFLAGFVGIWPDKLRGWWLAAMADLMVIGILIYNWVDEGWERLTGPLRF
jgi:hypothetical protein